MADNPFCDDVIPPLDPGVVAGIIGDNLESQADEIGKCCDILAREIETGLVDSGGQIDKVCKKAEKAAEKQTADCCKQVSDVVNNLTNVVTNILTENHIQNQMILETISNVINNNSSVISSVVGDTTTNTTNITGQTQPINVDVDVNSPVAVNLPSQTYEPTDINSVLAFIITELAELRKCCDDLAKNRPPLVQPGPFPIGPIPILIDDTIGKPSPIALPVPLPGIIVSPEPKPESKPGNDPVKYLPPNVDIDVFNTIGVNVNVLPTPVNILFDTVIKVDISNILPKVPLPNKPEEKKPDDKEPDKTGTGEDFVPTEAETPKPQAKETRFNDVATVSEQFSAYRFSNATLDWRKNAAALMRLPHLATIEDAVELVKVRHDIEKKMQVQPVQ